MTALSVNINKVALIRNARDQNKPDIIEFAKRCIEAGANGITVHPRPDRRHITFEDVELLSKTRNLKELNIEGNPFSESENGYPGLISMVEKTKPTQVTLVPDNRIQKTSDHGWDLHRDADRLLGVINKIQRIGCRVSLFLDPDPTQIAIAKRLNVDRIELYTEMFARAYESGEYKECLNIFDQTARAAQDVGIGVNAGHDLNQSNLSTFCHHVKGIREVSIGHALISDALVNGIKQTIHDYLDALKSS